MRRAATLGLWWVLIALLAGSPTLAFAQDDATPEGERAAEDGQIDRWRVQARLSPSLFGPEDGEIDHDPERVSLVPAGVSVRHFYARATFTNPYGADEQTFDYGFVVRRGRDATFSLYLDAERGWTADYGGSIVDSGPLDDIEVTDGGQNEIEVAAVGDEAYLAVNGDQVATVDISRRRVSGDVAIGTAFTLDALQEGATTPFEGFQVWSLDGLVDEAPAQPNPAGAELLDEGREIAQQDQPAFGPEAGDLTETGQGEDVQLSAAGVDLADFYLRMSVTTPRAETEEPWDVGIGFRDAGGNDQYRVTIASDGTWYFSLGIDPALRAGSFDGLETAVGSVNLVELAVSGDTAGLSVNGTHVATFALDGGPESGDIWLAAGLYLQDAVSGTVTEVEDFTIWILGAAAPTTPEAGETPEVQPPPDDGADDADAVAQVLEASQANPSLAGPESGEIEHDPERVIIAEIGVDVTDFVAHARFLNPYSIDEGAWDYGFEFRLTEDQHFRFYVTSNGEWILALGSQEILDQGEVTNLDLSDTGENELDVVVAGDQASLFVNGAFVATVDVSVHGESGDVAVGSAFLEGNFIAGEATPYEEFEVWELADVAVEPSPAPTEEVEPTEATEEPTEEVSTPEASPVAGEPDYISPTYDFSVTWDESWTEVDRTTQDEVDTLRLDNGVSTVDFYGYATTQTPGQCVDAEFTLFQTSEGYSDARVAEDENGQELRGEEDDRAWGVFQFIFTSEDGELTDYMAYVECRPIVPGESMVLVVQYVPEDQFESQEDAREDLLAGLETGAEEPVEVTATAEPTEPAETPEATEEPTEEPTEVVTEEATAAPTDGETVGVRLEAVGDSDVSGLATLTSAGDQTEITVIAIGGEPGSVVLIHDGGCDSLDPVPAHLLRELDATGSSTTTVNASIDELRGDFSIAIHTGVADLTQPIACGEIPDA